MSGFFFSNSANDLSYAFCTCSSHSRTVTVCFADDWPPASATVTPTAATTTASPATDAAMTVERLAMSLLLTEPWLHGIPRW